MTQAEHPQTRSWLREMRLRWQLYGFLVRCTTNHTDSDAGWKDWLTEHRGFVMDVNASTFQRFKSRATSQERPPIDVEDVKRAIRYVTDNEQYDLGYVKECARLANDVAARLDSLSTDTREEPT